MWQQVYQQHRDGEVEVIAIACDVQGASAAKPWVQKAGATFTTLIDTDNTLAAMFGFNFVPLTIWLNKDGTVARGPAGCDIRRDEERSRLAQWIDSGQVPSDDSQVSPWSDSQRDARLRVQFASRLLKVQKKEQALAQLRTALQADPDNWLIRKQIWAIEHPDRFYEGQVDYTWQRQQLKQERGKPNATD